MKKMTATAKGEMANNKRAEVAMRNRNCQYREMVENSARYRKAVNREMCLVTTRRIENELLDGIFLNLKERSMSKSASVQNRILRRIVEKRHAQANHKKNGRAQDLSSVYFTKSSISECLADIRRIRWAA